jgi:hypothetical protein
MPLRESTLAIAFVLVVSYVASACSCATSGTCAFSPTADVIFLGTVIDQRTGNTCIAGECSTDDPQTTTFLVREAFRGIDVQKIEVNTGAGTCTYPFVVGQSYLVFANRYKGELSTDKCMQTRAEVMAGALVQQLRAARSGQSMASLFGSVTLAPRDAYALAGQVHYKPETGVTIRITDRKGNSFETASDTTGAYAFTGIPRDEYDVSVELPLHTTTPDLVRNVSLLAGDMPDASLRKKLAGLPGDDVKSDGTFELSLVSPGQYYLRFQHMDGRRFVRGPAFGYGSAIILREGEHREGIVFVVPALGQLPPQR